MQQIRNPGQTKRMVRQNKLWNHSYLIIAMVQHNDGYRTLAELEDVDVVNLYAEIEAKLKGYE